MEPHPQDPIPEATSSGAAASYYHSTSPVPVPGATVLTPSGSITGLGLGLGLSGSGVGGGPPPAVTSAGGGRPSGAGAGAGAGGGAGAGSTVPTSGPGPSTSIPAVTSSSEAAPRPSGGGGGPGPSLQQQQRPQSQQQQQQQPHPTFDPPPLMHTSPLLVQSTAELMQSPGPITNQTAKADLKAARTGAEFALSEYMTLQRKRYRLSGGAGGEAASVTSGDLEAQIKVQADVVGRDLARLRADIMVLAKAAEKHRWRRWLIGGIIGTFIPAVRALFRRPRRGEEAEADKTSNDTEYAFYKSKSLVGRILDSVHGIGGLASMTFFVFAVMYVFQNEVSMRVAKTVGKRLKRLSAKVEAQQDIDERDMALLNGWRWRILTWA